MRKSDVKVGKSYWANVAGSRVPVRIESTNPQGGWVGRSIKTGRTVRIRTAGRLHGECEPEKVADVSASAAPNSRKRKKAPAKAAFSPKVDPKASKKAEKAKQRQAILDAVAKVLGGKKSLAVGEIYAALADKGLLSTCGDPNHGAIYYALKIDIDQNAKTRFARKTADGVTVYSLRKKK